MRLSILLLSVTGAVALSSCDELFGAQGSDGPQLITAVARHVEDGRPDQARAVLDRRRVPNPGYFDPSDAKYCTRDGVKVRLNGMAVDIARYILELENADPVARYAVFKKQLENALESQDGILHRLGICTTSIATLTVAYSGARWPIVSAAQEILDRYEQEARAHAVGDFDTAVDRAAKDHAAAKRKEQEEACRRQRRELEAVDSATDPLVARTLRTTVGYCRMMGL